VRLRSIFRARTLSLSLSRSLSVSLFPVACVSRAQHHLSSISPWTPGPFPPARPPLPRAPETLLFLSPLLRVFHSRLLSPSSPPRGPSPDRAAKNKKDKKGGRERERERERKEGRKVRKKKRKEGGSKIYPSILLVRATDLPEECGLAFKSRVRRRTEGSRLPARPSSELADSFDAGATPRGPLRLSLPLCASRRTWISGEKSAFLELKFAPLQLSRAI